MPLLSVGTCEVTMFVDSMPMVANMDSRTITMHYPLPSGIRHLGGRLQRKSRLRKKQEKYRFEKGYSFKGMGSVSDSKYETVDGVLEHSITFSMHKWDHA